MACNSDAWLIGREIKEVGFWSMGDERSSFGKWEIEREREREYNGGEELGLQLEESER